MATGETFVFAFLSFGTLLGALFLSPRMTILITIVSVLLPPVFKTVYLHRTWRLFGDEVIFLLGISLINLLVIVIRRADLNQIEQQSRELVEAEKRRVELIAEKERATALQQFIRNVSHDFRTPLTVINSSAYLIKRLTNQQQQQAHATIIEQQTTRLSTLIDDMVTVIRLDNGQDIQRQPVDVNRLVEQITQSIRPALNSKKLALNLELDNRLTPLAADRFALEMALRKLLDNAIQFNREGGSITVQTAANGDNVRLCITDTGIGIDAAHLPHIFDLLYRVDQARSTKTGGAGLGLPIVKKIVEAHGGTIAVASIPNQQTTFTITLPCYPATEG
jgi:signal transduction histidine kinase